jgi:hypothetical protein
MGRLAEALGIERPPPAYSGAALKQMSAAQFVQHEAQELFAAVQEPIAILFAAAMDAGIIPRNPKQKAPAKYKLFRDALVNYLVEDRTAAMVVSSLIQQFLEAENEYYALEAALETGDLEGLNIYKARGKFFYLARMHFAVEKYPLIAQLFPKESQGLPPAAPGPGSPGRQAPQTAPLAGHTPEGPRRGATQGGDSVGVLQGTVMGLRKQVSGALQGGTQQLGGPSPEQHRALLEQGNQLIKALQGKMLILQAALDKAQGRQASTEGFLPLPAMQTAETLAAALSQDRYALKLVTTTLQKYRDASFFMRRRSPEEHGRLRALLTDLGTLPIQLSDHAILSKLFPAA